VSLRLQLALWYGSLTVLVLLVMSVLTFAVHSRAHYDDLDTALLSSVEHVASKSMALENQTALTEAVAEPLGADVVVQVYGPDGDLLAASDDDAQLPIDPERVLHGSTGRPLGPLVRLAPSFREVDPGAGAFEIVTDDTGDQWRYYVRPIDGSPGYLVGSAPLSAIEGTISAFRTLVVLIVVFGTIGTFTVAWLVAGRALRPVADLTDTAGAIARSHRLSERVPANDRKDEMGQLATTFNQMLASLEEADRSQRRFVGDASHELRAPLTAIQANLELLLRELDTSPDDQHEMLEHANREAHRLSRLVADLLALARADAGLMVRKDRVEIDRVLLGALGEARNRANGQRIVVDSLEPAVVVGDEERLSQLLLILLDNALKYTSADGSVSLELTRDGSMSEIRIHDTGIGIAQQDLSHVFERFYRADPARSRDPGGTGLGLPIARWIVEQHGGSIVLESSHGAGTTAIIRLPTTG
jgi:two-component system, OmpR family, sensor kinase